MTTNLTAFHGKQEIKDKYLAQLNAHKIADEIIKGQYWQEGKGCAVGCTVHSEQHSAYETELGIPTVLAKLEDRIFEGLPNNEAKDFPIQFLSAINVGADLSNVWRKLMIWILVDETHGVVEYAKNKKVVTNVADAFKDSLTKTIPIETWVKLRNAADAAGYTADAAGYTADAAADAAGYAAGYAAEVAGYTSDAYTADAADVAAYAAAYVAAYVADVAAKQKHYSAMKDELLRLLTEAK